MVQLKLFSNQLVRSRGLEPPRVSPLAPQASASTNSAMAAGTPNRRGSKRRCVYQIAPPPTSRKRGLLAGRRFGDGAVADAHAGLAHDARLPDKLRHLDGDAVSGHHDLAAGDGMAV